MQIDATLLVQGCNFFVFYWIVRVFLFRPVISYIQAKERERQRLYDEIAQYQDELIALTNRRQALQRESTLYCMHNRPEVSHGSIAAVSLLAQETGNTSMPQDLDQLVKATSVYLLDAITKGL